VKRVTVMGWLVVSTLMAGCGPQRLPPGIPPPEYETRTLPPWPPGAAGAAGQAMGAAAEPSSAAAGAPGGAAGFAGAMPGPSPAAPAE